MSYFYPNYQPRYLNSIAASTFVNPSPPSLNPIREVQASMTNASFMGPNMGFPAGDQNMTITQSSQQSNPGGPTGTLLNQQSMPITYTITPPAPGQPFTYTQPLETDSGEIPVINIMENFTQPAISVFQQKSTFHYCMAGQEVYMRHRQLACLTDDRRMETFRFIMMGWLKSLLQACSETEMKILIDNLQVDPQYQAYISQQNLDNHQSKRPRNT